jgi:hypothetical protein
MSTKPALPPLGEELDPPRRRVDLKAIRPKGVADDATVAENSRRLGSQWGASTSLEQAGESSQTVPAVPRAPVASLRIEVPAYLDDELTQKAAARRVTKQFLVLTALRRDGYRIEDADLVADKRKARRKT